MAGIPAVIETISPAAMSFEPAQSVRENFAWSLAGNAVYAASQWGLLVALAKTGSPEHVGQFVLALALTSPLFVLSQFHLRALQASDPARFPFADYLGLRGTATAAALLISAAAILSLDREFLWVGLAVAVAKAFDSMSDIYHGFLQQQERMGRIGRSLMIRGALSLVALTAGLRFTGSVGWAAAGYAAAAAVVFLAYDWGAARAVKPSWNPAVWRNLVRITFPLTLVMLLIALNTAVPRYFLEHYRGSEELGVFAALSYFPIAGSTVVAAAGQAILPRLGRMLAAGDRAGFFRLWRTAAALATACSLLGLGIVAAGGKWIVALVYGPEYAQVLDVLNWVMAGSIPLYLASLTGYAITAAGVFRPQAWLYGIATLTTLVACATLIPPFGLRGAAIAFAAGSLVQMLGALFLLTQVGSFREP